MAKAPVVSLTVQILTEIRDEIRKTNARLDQTNARLDQTNARLDQTRDDVMRRLVESEVRTSTAIVGLAGTLNDVKQIMLESLNLRPRVERCEGDIREIKQAIKLG